MLLISAALSTGMIGGVWAQADMAPTSPPALGDPMAPMPEMPGTMAPGTQAPSTELGPPPGFSAGGSADLSETLVSNALGVSSGSGIGTGPDYDSRLTLSLYARDHTPRFNGDLQYSLVGDAFARHPSLNQLSNYLTALGDATLIPDRLLVQARAFVAPILVNQLGPIAAINRPVATSTNSGFRNTYGFTIAPELLFRLGNFANSLTTLSEGVVYFSVPNGLLLSPSIPQLAPPQQMTSSSLTQRFSSGSEFNRLNWSLTGTASKTTRSGGDLSEASGIADVQYAVSREFALLATGGYQSITTRQQLSHSLVGPTAMAGVRITLGPDFEAEAQAGRQFNFPSYVGSIRYQIGPFTNLSGSVTDSIETPGQRLLSNLGALGVNSSGDFFNTSFGSNAGLPGNSTLSPFDPAPIDGSPINSSVSRFRTASLSLSHEADIAQFRLTGFRTKVNQLTVLTGIPTLTSTGAMFIVSRNLNPSLTGSVNAGFTRQELLGGSSSSYSTQLNLTYSFSPATQAYLLGAYIHRLSSTSLVAATSPLSGSVSDASVTIGIRRLF